MSEAARQQLAADCKIVYKHLPAEVRQFVQNKFNDMDTDSSGTVSRAELFKMHRAYNPDSSRSNSRLAVREIMKLLDADNSGELDFEECITLCMFLVLEPFWCASCERFLVLDVHFFACALCWENVQRGLHNVRCDGSSDGCFIYCQDCVAKSVRVEHCEEFALVATKSGALRRSDVSSEFPVLSYYEVCPERKVLDAGAAELCIRPISHLISHPISELCGLADAENPQSDVGSPSVDPNATKGTENLPQQTFASDVGKKVAVCATDAAVKLVAAELLTAGAAGVCAVGGCSIM